MNRTTNIIVSTIGVLLGLTGIDHGFFEILQGNQPTNGLIIQAIGPAQKMWAYGGEEAFTLIPNFLVTGILAVIVSVVIIIWSVGFIHCKHGATVFLLLAVLLFLVGGGIAAPIIFAPLIWAAATRINKPLTWWRKRLSNGAVRVLGNLWLVSLIVGSVSLLIGVYIAITGYVPGVSSSDPERILNICWAFIFGGGLGMFLLSFVAGFARDIQQSNNRETAVYG